MSEVAFWGYGLAALLYGGFGLYAFVAWRGGVQGAVLLVAVLASCLWAAANAAADFGLLRPLKSTFPGAI